MTKFDDLTPRKNVKILTKFFFLDFESRTDHINKHEKSEGGVIGFSRNFQSYNHWVLTRHERALYAAAAFIRVARMSDDRYDRRKYLHKNNRHKGLIQVEKTFLCVCHS